MTGMVQLPGVFGAGDQDVKDNNTLTSGHSHNPQVLLPSLLYIVNIPKFSIQGFVEVSFLVQTHLFRGHEDVMSETHTCTPGVSTCPSWLGFC